MKRGKIRPLIIIIIRNDKPRYLRREDFTVSLFLPFGSPPNSIARCILTHFYPPLRFRNLVQRWEVQVQMLERWEKMGQARLILTQCDQNKFFIIVLEFVPVDSALRKLYFHFLSH